MRVFDRLEDTPAQIVNAFGETLAQTRPAVALLGDETGYTGMERSRVYRWFTDPSSRRAVPAEDRRAHGRTLVAQLARAVAASGADSPGSAVVTALRDSSEEFAALWDEHPIVGPYCEPKRILHDELGVIELYGQTLLDPDQSQALMVFTAEPGSESHEKLRLLSAFQGGPSPAPR